MSVTSATEIFTDGAELFNQEKYQSTVTTSFDPDPTQMEQDFKRPLSHRIIPIHSHTKSIYGEYRLDDVIVRCPSEAFREHQKQQWDTIKKEKEEKSWIWTAVLIGSLAAVGIGFAPTPFAPIFLVAGAIGSIASIVFLATTRSSINQANDQINKWDADPVMKVGKAREEAHKQGFPYIYANKLKLGQGPSKTALFHPLHVEYEYKKYFNSFCNKLLDQVNPVPASWMNQFCSSNPVSPECMIYGLGYIPEHMKPVLEDCSHFKSFLSDITSSYDNLKSEHRRIAKESIEAHTKTRNEQLQPLAEARDTGIAKAEADRDRVLRDTQNIDARQAARTTFAAIKEALQDNYTRNATPITKKYDAKIKEIERKRDEWIRKLDEQKGSQLGNNYRAARELLVRARQAWENKGYQPVNFQQYFAYQTAQPVWVQQQPAYYQPSVYQQQPAYQPNAQNVYPQFGNPGPQYGNPGYGHFGYGHAGQNPAQQQYYYVQQPTPPRR
jgi:hypothetical protein